MYSYGPPHMAEQKQDDQLEHTYSSSVRIQDVALKTCQGQWMIGRSGERGSRISVLVARHDDDDDDLSTYLSNHWWWVIERVLSQIQKELYLNIFIEETHYHFKKTRKINSDLCNKSKILMRLRKFWTTLLSIYLSIL